MMILYSWHQQAAKDSNIEKPFNKNEFSENSDEEKD